MADCAVCETPLDVNRVGYDGVEMCSSRCASRRQISGAPDGCAGCDVEQSDMNPDDVIIDRSGRLFHAWACFYASTLNRATL